MSVEEASEKLFINPTRLRAALEKLAAEAPEAVALEGGEVCIRDLVEAALAAARMGAPESLVARSLDWRDFERFTAKALEEAGFQVYRNLRLTWPKGFEVDVLGLDKPAHLGLVVDCKHWNPRSTPPSRLRQAAIRHRERVERLARYWWKLHLPKGPWTLIPVIVVLREQNTPKLVEGVFVVPASQLKGFLRELPELRELSEVYKTKSSI